MIFFNQFEPNAAFHTETSHLICSANQMTGFCMKWNTRVMELSFIVEDHCYYQSDMLSGCENIVGNINLCSLKT